MGNAVVVNTRNRILSQNLMMSLDTRHTDLNNNIFVIGGPGSGKTFRFVKSNLMQLFGSYVITDPKGEIMRDSAGFMKHFGYQVKVLNLLNAKGMQKSSRYNPFKYISNDTDIEKLVTTFMAATQKKDAKGGEQFWEDMASLALQAIFSYVYYFGVEVEKVIHHDFKGVMKLVNMLKVEEDARTGARKETELDRMFKKVERQEPNHPAVLNYNKAMTGAADTVRSIVSTVHSRTGFLQSKELLDLLSDDEIDIKSIGVRKTVVYCIIPDNDKTYNSLVSMLYQQMIQQMYFQADFVYGGSLPVHVTFMLDEYYNVYLPDEFCAWLTTMRSRGLSAIIIIQIMAQIKERHKDIWEAIPGSCDTFIYLGNNEQSTHEYISKLLDKMTIDKQTQGQTRGKQGSSSTNEDVLGRELMLPGEVRKMSRKQCLVIINGKDPVLDYKYMTPNHPLWKIFVTESKKYRFDARLERKNFSNLIAINTGGQSSTVKILDQVELNLLKAESQRQQEEYEEELKVAQITGEEAPDAPELPVMNLTLPELAAYVASLDEEEPEFPESELDYEDLEDAIARYAEDAFWEQMENPEEYPAAAVLEQYTEVQDEPEEAEEMEVGSMEQRSVEQQKGEVQIKNDKKQRENRLLLVTQLSEQGFSMEQIQVMKPVLDNFNVDQLTDIFTPDMTCEKMKIVLDILCA